MSLKLGRRGFLSTLGGLLLGKAVGPVETPEPDRTQWMRATDPALLRGDSDNWRNLYVPLEAVCAKTIEVLDAELKWLRLNQCICSMYGGSYSCVPDPKMKYVRLQDRGYVDIGDEITTCRSIDDAVKCFVQPAAYCLAERVINGVRRRGGGEYLITEKLPVVNEVEKCVVATHEDRGLTVRAVRQFNQLRSRPSIRVDISYGVG